MKLTRLKGIAHDLASNLNFEIWHGQFKDVPKRLKVKVLHNRSKLESYCFQFFYRSMTTTNIRIKVKVDDKEFSSGKMALIT